VDSTWVDDDALVETFDPVSACRPDGKCGYRSLEIGDEASEAWVIVLFISGILSEVPSKILVDVRVGERELDAEQGFR